MLYVILSVFAAAACAPWLIGIFRDRVGWVLALVPAASTLYFANFIACVGEGAVVLQSWQWLPGLGINLSFMLDGLSLMFALLISFIGTFVLIYAGSYLKGHIYLGRFYTTLLCFMASMLGLVLSDNLISLFVFWELTSVTSYLLIGFNHEDKDARKYALQGLFVTAGGGLALMAGLILLGWSSGSYQFSSILAGESLAGHPLAVGMILCILLGTFTKSAQFPFHFWLPNAMAAPTPVSAYLHSATMVKAGVYLMARLNPTLGEHPLWMWLLCSAGAITMLLGAYLSFSATGVKKVLAYSTVMALGTLTLLIGIGTETAMIAFASFLLAHSLYKGALFMVAGSLDHATGTKDLTLMGGLRKPMPITATAALVAGLSLAGLPPLFGFVGKELLLGAAIDAPWMGNAILASTVVASALGVAVAALVAIKPFFGPLGNTPKQAHETSIAMWIGPAVLAATSLIFGLLPFLPESWFLTAAVTSVHGSAIDFYLSLWHGINLPLILSMINLVAGIALYKFWLHKRQHLTAFNNVLSNFGPEAGYFKTMEGITRIASWQTRVLQNGVLGHYMIVLVLAAVGLVGYTLLSQHPLSLQFAFDDLKFYEAVIAVFMAVSTIYVICTRSRLAAVASVGVLGFSVALIFIHFSAPDLGITQMLVETLTVILLVLVLFRLPSFSNYSTRFEVIRDAIVAALFGILMMLLVLAAIDVKFFESISAYFIEASYPEAKGRNIVNVILVDFRALDTLGEIFVLAIAALGVFSMLHLRGEKKVDGP